MKKITDKAKRVLAGEHERRAEENEDYDKGFLDGLEFGCAEAMRWRSLEDELPEIGDEIVLKSPDRPHKSLLKVKTPGDINYCNVHFTHWKYIE